jgi:hypothetical protein
VKTTRSFTPEMEKQTKIVIFIPDRGGPLDITLQSEDDRGTVSSPYLKVFLLEDIDTKKAALDFKKGDVILMDRHTLDMRIVIHAFDQYLEKVVVPEKDLVEDFFKSPLAEEP